MMATSLQILSFTSLFCLTAVTCWAQGPAHRLAIKPVIELEVSRTDVHLSDIVATNGLSRTALEAFRAVRLSDAPSAGETLEFTAATVADLIKPDIEAIEKETGEHFEMKIPSRVTVTKAKPTFGAADLKQQLVSRFKSLCADCEFEISNFSAPALTAKLPSSADWTLRTRNEIPKGSFSYPIEITVGDVQTQTYWVSGQLTIRRQVPVAAREVMAGEHLKPNDLITQLMDVTFSTDAPASLRDVSSSVAARQLAVGQIVFQSSLRREPAIQAGDLVKVETKNAEWEISLDGVSQSSGFIGDRINVKIPSTMKVVAGVLREKGVVEVIQ